MKKVFLTIYLLSIAAIYSQNEVIWEKSIDWENNIIKIDVRSPLEQSDSTLAASRRRAQIWVDDNKTNIFFKNILDIDINSIETVSEIINKSPETYYKLNNLAEELTPDSNILSTNLEYLDTQYSFPIYPDFVSLFYTGSQHIKNLKKLDHRDYGEFTGLIIYVPEEIPLYRKSTNGNLNKVLFPRIYDDQMNLIMDFSMIDPEYMKKWGMVLYGESFDENRYETRIGVSPLRIIAKGLFGKNNSDIIISAKDAEKLIGTENNLNIISQSRILILNQEKEDFEE